MRPSGTLPIMSSEDDKGARPKDTKQTQKAACTSKTEVYSSFSLKVLSLNHQGNGKKKQSKDLSPAKVRHEIVPRIIQDKMPDVIIIQEPSRKVHRIFPGRFRGIEYRGGQNEQSGILYNTSDLMRVTAIDPNAELRKLRDKMVKSKRLTNADELCARIYAVILQHKGTNAQVLCISYHGPYSKKTVPTRLNITNALLKLINEYQIKKCLPVILGGDFNVDIQINLEPITIKVNVKYGSEQTSKYGLMELHPYCPTGRRDKIFDFLLTSASMEVTSLEPINIAEEVESIDLDIKAGDIRVILDHDPLVGSISIPCTKSPLYEIPDGSKLKVYVLSGNEKKCALKDRPKGTKALMWK